MKQTAIFLPFLAMMLLTMVVWFVMYAKRLPFIRRSGLQPNQVTAAELARLSPPSVANPSDNLKNLFEIPTLFYALILYIFSTGQVDGGYLLASWIFVAFRILHSAVHCTVNIVLLRFWLYCASALALWYMLLRAALRAFLV